MFPLSLHHLKSCSHIFHRKSFQRIMYDQQTLSSTSGKAPNLLEDSTMDETLLDSPSSPPLVHCKDPFLASFEFTEVSPSLALARCLSTCSRLDMGITEKQDLDAGHPLGQTGSQSSHQLHKHVKKSVTVSKKTKKNLALHASAFSLDFINYVPNQ